MDYLYVVMAVMNISLTTPIFINYHFISQLRLTSPVIPPDLLSSTSPTTSGFPELYQD